MSDVLYDDDDFPYVTPQPLGELLIKTYSYPGSPQITTKTYITNQFRSGFDECHTCDRMIEETLIDPVYKELINGTIFEKFINSDLHTVSDFYHTDYTFNSEVKCLRCSVEDIPDLKSLLRKPVLKLRAKYEGIL